MFACVCSLVKSRVHLYLSNDTGTVCVHIRYALCTKGLLKRPSQTEMQHCT